MKIKIMILLCPMTLIASLATEHDIFQVMQNRPTKEMLNSLFQKNPRVFQAKNELGQTPLMSAIFNRKQQLAAEILRYMDETSINEQDSQGNSALHYAIIYKVPIALRLMNKGASLNIPNRNKETPIHLAACYEDRFQEVVLGLACANLSAQDKDGNTALHIAAKYGATATVEALLSSDPSIIDIPNHFKTTALHLAIIQSATLTPETTRLLFEAIMGHNPDISLQDDQGYTVIHLAALFHTDCVSLRSIMRKLLRLSKDSRSKTIYELKTMDGKTAYELAKKFNKQDMMKILDGHKNRAK